MTFNERALNTRWRLHPMRHFKPILVTPVAAASVKLASSVRGKAWLLLRMAGAAFVALNLGGNLAAQIIWIWDTATPPPTLSIGGLDTLNIAGNVNHDHSGVLTNSGTINWEVGAGPIRSASGGGITNESGGVFNDSASSNISSISGTATFTNNGTYQKLATGTTTISQVFNNSGSVLVSAGTLSLTGGGGSAGTATFNVAAESALTFGAGTHTLAGGSSFTGSGTISLASGTVAIPSGNASFSNLTLGGGTLSGAGNASIASLTSTSGSLTLSSLTLTGTSAWSGGSWSSSSASTATIASGATLTIGGTADHEMDSRTITNHGTVDWTGGRLRSGHAGGWLNHGTFNDSASRAMNNDWGGTLSTFTNAASGIYNKTAAGTTTFFLPFNNSGAVNVTAGTLSLTGGGSSSGTFTTGAGGTVSFDNSYTVTDGSSLLGSGAYRVTGGTFTVSGAVNVAGFDLIGGTLAGTHTFNGGLAWKGGSLNSSGTTTIASGATFAIAPNLAGNAFDHDFVGRHIVNHGTVAWQTGAGRLRSGSGGTITNHGTFTDSASNVVNNDFGGTALVFTNTATGTYNKNAAGTTRFDVRFDNDGAVSVNAGTLQLNGGGTNSSSATFTAAENASVLFSSNYAISDGTALLGSGSYRVTGGTFTVNGGVNVSNFQFSGGTLAGTQTFNGGIAWNGGSLNSSGTTTIGSGSTLAIAPTPANTAFDHDFNTRTIVNHGTVNWEAGAGRLRAGGGAVFTNTGTFNDHASSTINNDYGGTSLVFTTTTTGIYNKLAAGTTVFSVPFNNDGAVQIATGTLQLGNGGVNSSTGTFTAAEGAGVLFTNNYTINDGSALLGAGSYRVSGGTFTVNGAVDVSNFQFSGGTLAGTHTFAGGLSWSGGSLNSAGTTTIGSGATLAIAPSAANTPFDHDFNGRALVNHGTIAWQTNAGRLRAGGGATLTNHGTFNDHASNVVNNDYGGTALVITNAETGAYHKLSAGATRFDVRFDNHGSIAVGAGTLQFNGGGTNSATGTIDAAAGTSVVFSNNYTLANASALTGAGAYSLTGGTLTATGTVNVSNFTIAGGTLAGTQTFNGGVVWRGGSLNSAGTTTIAAGTTFAVAPTAAGVAFDHDFNARTIINHGTLHWQAGAGRLRSGGGGAITNNALFIDSAGSAMNNDYGGTVLVFTNSAGATYRKTSSGNTDILVPFVNRGLLDLQAGQLRLFSSSTFHDGSSMTGDGLLQLLGGTLTASGAMTFSNFQIAGGTVSGEHSFGGNIAWTGGNFNNTGQTTITGTFEIGGTGDHDFSSHSFINNGVVNWNAGRLRSGQGGTFVNHGLFNDSASTHLSNDYGGTAWTFTNTAGAIYNKQAAGTTTFLVPFTNDGLVHVAAGTLAFSNTFTNSGSISLANNATAQFSSPLSIPAALSGSGTISAASVTAGGVVAPGSSAGSLTITGNLTLLSTSLLLIELGGTAQGQAAGGYDFLNIDGNGILAGTLSLSFLNGFESIVQPTDTFTIVAANGTGGLTGAFANIASGGRLFTGDGFGSFQVNYGGGSLFAANSVVLSNFVAVPEPSTWAMIGVGGALVLLSLRRRR